MATALLLLLALPVAFAVHPQQAILEGHQYDANLQSASENANLIFNSVHNSMRQWGSSIQHNGMSFIPASIPEGTLFYHGRGTPEPVTGMEWLAFEVEHAEVFARSRGGRGGPPGDKKPPFGTKDDKDDHGPAKGGPGRGGPGGPGGPGGGEPGYLHVYRTNRRLDRILYIDGMSAGKTNMGTLDTQDILLLSDAPADGAPMGGEVQRAQGLCELGKQWGGVDGFLRMEAGFEIIYCNFEDGLDFVQAHKRPNNDAPEGLNEDHQFEYVRAIAARYHDIGGNRVDVDYSSMVSAFFYPANLSNPKPDPAQYLPRLVSTAEEQLERIKSDLEKTWNRKKTSPSVQWQGIVDMLIWRYSDRLRYLASGIKKGTFLSELNVLLNVYINYADLSLTDSLARCADHYLLPALPSTPEDKLIHHALHTVTSRICSTLFDVRADLVSEDEDGSAVETVTEEIKNLIKWLNWTSFQSCGTCKVDEVCYVAIWPWGTKEDHFNPRCKNSTEAAKRDGEGYWGHGPGGPGGPGGPRGPPEEGKDEK